MKYLVEWLVAAGPRIFPRVDVVAIALVVRHKNPIGPINLMSNDSRDGSVRIDAIHALDWLAVRIHYFQSLTVSIAWVGEVDPPFRILGEVIGRRESLSGISIR